MEREDPLEKLERKQAEKQSNGGLKALMVAMIVIALGLAAALYYVWSSKSRLVGDLNEEKADLTEQIQALQSDYENLSSEYDSINAQLDSSREEIAQLVDRVKRTEATDRAKIRQYEKELGTLRSIMRGYISQIDSLQREEILIDSLGVQGMTPEGQSVTQPLDSALNARIEAIASGMTSENADSLTPKQQQRLARKEDKREFKDSIQDLTCCQKFKAWVRRCHEKRKKR